MTATDEDIGKIRHGRTVNLPEMSRSRLVKVFAGQSELICIASRVAGTLFHPKVVLCGLGLPVKVCAGRPATAVAWLLLQSIFIALAIMRS